MARLVSELLFGTGATLVTVGIVITLLLSGFLPLMAWSATRNIRQIREQLERLNDTLEGRGSIGRSGSLGL